MLRHCWNNVNRNFVEKQCCNNENFSRFWEIGKPHFFDRMAKPRDSLWGFLSFKPGASISYLPQHCSFFTPGYCHLRLAWLCPPPPKTAFLASIRFVTLYFYHSSLDRPGLGKIGTYPTGLNAPCWGHSFQQYCDAMPRSPTPDQALNLWDLNPQVFPWHSCSLGLREKRALAVQGLFPRVSFPVLISAKSSKHTALPSVTWTQQNFRRVYPWTAPSTVHCLPSSWRHTVLRYVWSLRLLGEILGTPPQCCLKPGVTPP
jgi:hypothetical protein